MNKTEYINALCLAFPNGQNVWIEANVNKMEKAIQKWKKKNPEYEENDFNMGAVQIRMLKSDFEKINSEI